MSISEDTKRITPVEERTARAVADAAGMNFADIDLAVIRFAILAVLGEPVAWLESYRADDGREVEIFHRTYRDPDHFLTLRMIPLYAGDPILPKDDEEE